MDNVGKSVAYMNCGLGESALRSAGVGEKEVLYSEIVRMCGENVS